MKLVRVLLAAGLFWVLTGSIPAWGEKITGALAGDGGDSNNCTFSFSSNNTTFQMLNPDNSALTVAQISFNYGSSLQIFNNGSDYLTGMGLKPQGADLSGTLWTNAVFPTLGNVALDPATGRFKFAAPAWLTAAPIDNDPAGLTTAQIAMNASGQAMAVFMRYGLNLHVYANLYLPGKNWLGETEVDNGNTHDAIAAAIALNNNGQAMAAFIQGDGLYNRISANLYSLNNGWNGCQIIGANPVVGNAQNPQVAISSDGHALAVWTQLTAAGTRLFSNMYSPSSGWYGAVTIDAGSAYAIDSSIPPELAMNSAGQAVAVFEQKYGADNRIYAAQYLPASGWHPAALIDPGPGYNASAPQVAINASGQEWASFLQSNATQQWAEVNHFTPGSGWGSPASVDNGVTYLVCTTSIACNDQGQAVCIFGQPTAIGGNNRLFARSYNPLSSVWGAAVTIDKGNFVGLGLGNGQVKLNNSGKAVAVFEQQNAAGGSSPYCVFANEMDTPGNWNGAGEIDSAPSNIFSTASVPAIALNDNGQAACVMIQWDVTGNVRNYAAVFRGDAPTGTVQVNYYAAASGTPTPSPTPTPILTNTPVSSPENKLVVTQRKLEPLLGQKTHIHFGVTGAGLVSVKIYNLQGALARTLMNSYQSAGICDLDWAGENNADELVASGVYIIQVKTPAFTHTQKVVVIK